MEANVDIQKLQILNDRIAQALEALDQVRFSVHGLSHTTPLDPWAGQQVQGRVPWNLGQQYNVPFTGATMPLQGIQHTTLPTQMSPFYGAVPFSGQIPGVATGLMHTSPEYVQQRDLTGRIVSDPVRLSQTFPYLMVPSRVPTIPIW